MESLSAAGKWEASLARLVGNVQKAQELLKKWNELIVETKSELVTRRI
jgi:hypothetical protein